MNNIKKATLALAFTTAISMPLAVSAEKTGEDIFKQNCSTCHGTDGKGRLPGTPNFTDSAGPLSKSNSDLVKNITNGFRSEGNKGMSMPAQKGKFSEKEITNTVKYLKSTFKK